MADPNLDASHGRERHEHSHQWRQWERCGGDDDEVRQHDGSWAEEQEDRGGEKEEAVYKVGPLVLGAAMAQD